VGVNSRELIETSVKQLSAQKRVAGVVFNFVNKIAPRNMVSIITGKATKNIIANDADCRSRLIVVS